MVAQVADFGLSRFGSDEDNNWKTHVTTKVSGTRGYLDPEYVFVPFVMNSFCATNLARTRTNFLFCKLITCCDDLI